MSRNSCQPIERIFLAAVLVALFVRGGMVAIQNGADFAVYWQAGRTFWESNSPQISGFVFKYPPWALPFFFPLGLFPLGSALGIWFLISYSSLLVILWDLYNRWHIRPRTLALVLLGFWWIIIGHFSMGQISLLMGAVLTRISSRPVLNAYLQSFKIFTLGFLLPKTPPLKKSFFFLTFITFATAVALSISHHTSPSEELLRLFNDWIASSTSGAQDLGLETIRGPANHGLNVLILRAIEAITGMNFTTFGSIPEIAIFCYLIGAGWLLLRKYVSKNFWIWPAWVTLTLPLAWHHSFVLVIPLAATVLTQANRTWFQKIAPWIGIACVSLVIPQTVGNSTFLRCLELCGIKTWGTFLLIYLGTRACNSK